MGMYKRKKRMKKATCKSMVIILKKMFQRQLWIFRKIGAKYKKRYSVSLGVMIIAWFSIFMLIMMGYSFIYLQKDHSTCVVPAMYPSYIRLSGFDKKYTKYGKEYGLYLYKERKVLNVHNVCFFFVFYYVVKNVVSRNSSFIYTRKCREL